MEGVGGGSCAEGAYDGFTLATSSYLTASDGSVSLNAIAVGSGGSYSCRVDCFASGGDCSSWTVAEVSISAAAYAECASLIAAECDCADSGAACDASAQGCCSGLCDGILNQCATCLSAGNPCGVDSECCSGSCDSANTGLCN